MAKMSSIDQRPISSSARQALSRRTAQRRSWRCSEISSSDSSSSLVMGTTMLATKTSTARPYEPSFQK